MIVESVALKYSYNFKKLIHMSIQAIDLFSGAGGFTLAAFQANVDVIAAVELDEAAAKTYQRNFADKSNLVKIFWFAAR